MRLRQKISSSRNDALGKLAGFFVVIGLLGGCGILHPASSSLPPRNAITPGEVITVEGNQNIYAVARAHNVSTRDLIVLNSIQPPFTIRPGQRLVLPATGSGDAAAGGFLPPVSAAPSSAIEQVPLAPIQTAPPLLNTDRGQQGVRMVPPRIAPVEALNQPKQPPKPMATTVTSDRPEVAPRPAPEISPSVEMAWPVQGPILSSFGPKGQGLNNDGVNIGAPKGAPVTAAARGIVVYAGNEMKGFGNLILIRHEGGWVTAYAHLQRMLVSKDAVVAQGDMIGTVGKTGNVPSPQLHFEVRHDGKPVDPAGIVKS